MNLTPALALVLVACFSSLVTAAAASENFVPKLTNIDYIGLGYDAFLGNPHTDLHDPGFRESVIALTYVNQTASADGKWLVPDNIQALQTFSCSYQSDTIQVSGLTSYQDTLSIDAEVHGGFFVAKFSASTDYKEIHEGTNTYRNVYINSVAKCIHYEAMIRSRSRVQLSDAFVDGVTDLPDTANDEEYMNFISVFGTHYASVVVMGAKAVIKSEFSEMTWSHLDETDFNVKVGAEASFLGFTGGASASTDKEKQAREQFESNRTTYRAAFIGSQPSKDGKWQTWAESTVMNPYPVEYKLRPITELLIPRHFPRINSTSVLTKQKLLADAYTRYCGNISGCDVPGPDHKPLKMNAVNSSFIDQQQVSCRPGYSLFSCGLNNLDNTPRDEERYSFPLNPRTCSCGASAGAVCVAWCSNSVIGYQQVSSGIRTGVFQARCAADKKVVGCHMASSFTKLEEWRQFYPSTDGKGCTCYDRFGAECIASCASNITSYEIREEYGTDVVQVRCSPGNYALGCGVLPMQGRGPEGRRYAFVDSLNSCQCYDHFGLTCFAICGRVN